MWDTLHRPLRYADVLGQEANVKILKARIANGTAFDISYVFAGGYGRGKTTLARIHARAMLCRDLDKRDPEPCNRCESCVAFLAKQPGPFSERDAASINGVDAARSLVEELPYAIEHAAKRIYLLDEAHRLTGGAQDVLLKPIEEKLMVAMLCTTEYEKLGIALRSRCETYIIGRVSADSILARARLVLDEHQIAYEDEAVLMLVDKADGHVRDVLIALESLAQAGPITVEHVREHLNLPAVSLFYRALLNLHEPKEALQSVGEALARMSPLEVSVGLAEAAFAAHKLANKVAVNTTLVDRRLALQVFERYGEAVLAIAHWFLADKAPTRTTLELRVASFRLQGQVAPASAPMVQLPALPVVTRPALVVVPAQAEPPRQLPEPTAPEPVVALATTMQVAAAQSTPAKVPSLADIGEEYQTAQELTMSKAKRPRGRSNAKKQEPPPKPTSTPAALTAGEWREQFIMKWNRSKPKNRG